MPQLIVTPTAVGGIDRCLNFLAGRDERAAGRASSAIRQRLSMLRQHPAIGRPVADDLRELTIPFGSAGYVALYRYDPAADAVLVLALRHQREAGY